MRKYKRKDPWRSINRASAREKTQHLKILWSNVLKIILICIGLVIAGALLYIAFDHKAQADRQAREDAATAEFMNSGIKHHPSKGF